jgi:hypothetical protein
LLSGCPDFCNGDNWLRHQSAVPPR